MYLHKREDIAVKVLEVNPNSESSAQLILPAESEGSMLLNKAVSKAIKESRRKQENNKSQRPTITVYLYK